MILAWKIDWYVNPTFLNYDYNVVMYLLSAGLEEYEIDSYICLFGYKSPTIRIYCEAFCQSNYHSDSINYLWIRGHT